MLLNSHLVRHRASGFSLVEIMVGMVIGLLGILVIMQVFSVSEARKRTTTSGDDAQNNGAIALYGLQRDIQQSGYGISSYHLIGCNVQLRTGVTLNTIAPVTINHASIPAGDANTDTLLVVYGTSNGATEGDGITSQPAAEVAATYSAASPQIYAMQSQISFVTGDQVIAEPQVRSSPCNLILDRVTAISTASTANIIVAAGVSAMSGGTLYNLGQVPKVQAYAIRSGNLTVCDYMVNDCSLAANTGNTAIWVPIASSIVSMRAQYGRDTNSNPMDGVVDVYDQTTPTNECGWMKASAIRLVLVARSSQKDPNVVTTSVPPWLGDATNPIDLTKNPDGSTNPNWQNYRYRTFQTSVPIRNIAWQGVTTGC